MQLEAVTTLNGCCAGGGVADDAGGVPWGSIGDVCSLGSFRTTRARSVDSLQRRIGGRGPWGSTMGSLGDARSLGTSRHDQGP